MKILLTENFNELNIPDKIASVDVEWEDLGIEVEEEGVEYTNVWGPMDDYGDTGEVDSVRYGTVNRWHWYGYEPTEQDYADYLGVDSIDEITQEMLDDIDADDLAYYLSGKYQGDAEDEARDNWDSDDVDWHDEYDESLSEGRKKKRKKKPYSSKSITTGDIGYNIAQFNKRMGTDFDKGMPNGAMDPGDGCDGECDGENCAGGCGEAVGESLTEEKLFSPKARVWIDCPEQVKLLQKEDVSKFLQELAPEEVFTVGYVTPIYFYKKLLDKFSLMKCIEMRGYTGVDYRDVKRMSTGGTDAEAAAYYRATDQINNPDGNTYYGVGYNTENKRVKSKLSRMRKEYGENEINKTVKQRDVKVNREYKDGEKPEIVSDLKTILFYPLHDTHPKVRYFIDLKDGDGYTEIGSRALREVIYQKVVELTKEARLTNNISDDEDMTDAEMTWLKSIDAKVQQVIDSEQQTVDTTTFGKTNVRSLYTSQVYYLKSSKSSYGKSLNESLDQAGEELTEAKRYVRRYYIRPQQIFCSNKMDILKALIDLGDQNCSVYTLNNLGDVKDVTKLTNKDIIYYYDDGMLYDKNRVKVMDYDLSIKHEEERQKFSGSADNVSDEVFANVYDDRMTDVTNTDEVVESVYTDAKGNTLAEAVCEDGTRLICSKGRHGSYEVTCGRNCAESYGSKRDAMRAFESMRREHSSSYNPFNEDWDAANAFGAKLVEGKEYDGFCCICGEEIEGYGNNAEPYKSGRCCDLCNAKFVLPARMEAAFGKDGE